MIGKQFLEVQADRWGIFLQLEMTILALPICPFMIVKWFGVIFKVKEDALTQDFHKKEPARSFLLGKQKTEL